MSTDEEILLRQDNKCAICGRPISHVENLDSGELDSYQTIGSGDKRIAVCTHCFTHRNGAKEYPLDEARDFKPIKFRRSLVASIILVLLFGWIGMLYTNVRKSGLLLLFSAVGMLASLLGYYIACLAGGVSVGFIVMLIISVIYVILYVIMSIKMCIFECRRINSIWDAFYTDDYGTEVKSLPSGEIN